MIITAPRKRIQDYPDRKQGLGCCPSELIPFKGDLAPFLCNTAAASKEEGVEFRSIPKGVGSDGAAQPANKSARNSKLTVSAPVQFK